MPSDTFDPYHKWLGIPPDEQPPHHYRLLGIAVFESDPGVIASAADRQMVHLRTFGTSKNASLAQRLLNEVAAAKVTLLRPEKKQAYDTGLHARLQASAPSRQLGPPPLPSGPPPLPTATPQSSHVSESIASPSAAASARTEPAFDFAPKRRSSATVARVRPPRRRSPLLLSAAIIIGGAAIAAVLIMTLGQNPYLAPRRDKSDKTAKKELDPQRPETSKPDPFEKQPSNLVENETDEDAPEVADPAPSADKGSAKKRKSGKGKRRAPQAKPLPSADANPAIEVSGNPAKSSDDPPLDVEPNSGNSRAIRTGNLASLLEEPVRPPKEQLRPVPSAQEQAAAEKTLRELMKDEFTKAKTPATRLELAAKLRTQGIETVDDPAAQFVQLRHAIDLSAEAGQSDTAWEIIDELGRRFQTDPLGEKEAALKTAGRLAKTAYEHHDLAESWVLLVDQAIAADDYAIATRCAAEAKRTARLANDPLFVKFVDTGTENLEQIKEAFETAKPARDTLATNPADAAAAVDWGRFLCAYKNDWKAGLPLWAKTSDRALADRLRRDLSNPTDADTQSKLGDEWLAAANGEKENLPQKRFKTRAEMWYRRALPNLSGLTKARVAKQADEIYQEISPFGGGQVVDVLGMVDPKRHARAGEWGRVRNQIGLVKPHPHAWLYLPVALRGDYELTIQFRRGRDDVAWADIYLPLGSGRVRCHIVLGPKPKLVFGRNAAEDSPEIAGTRLASGGRHRIKVVVRDVGERAQVVAEVNGRRALNFEGPVAPHHFPWMAEAPRETIGFGTADATLIYEAATLRVISGTAETLP